MINFIEQMRQEAFKKAKEYHLQDFSKRLDDLNRSLPKKETLNKPKFNYGIRK